MDMQLAKYKISPQAQAQAPRKSWPVVGKHIGSLKVTDDLSISLQETTPC